MNERGDGDALSYFQHAAAASSYACSQPLPREKAHFSSVTERRRGSTHICMHAYDMTWALSAQNERERAEERAEREKEPISIYACSRTLLLPSLHIVICVYKSCPKLWHERLLGCDCRNPSQIRKEIGTFASTLSRNFRQNCTEMDLIPRSLGPIFKPTSVECTTKQFLLVSVRRAFKMLNMARFDNLQNNYFVRDRCGLRAKCRSHLESLYVVQYSAQCCGREEHTKLYLGKERRNEGSERNYG